MTQSDNIVEFLKYASPRLDYIEHCMEKQADIFSTVARFASKPVKRVLSYKRVVNKAPKGSPGMPGSMGNQRYAQQYAARNVTISKALMGSKQYAAEVMRLTKAGYTPAQANRIVQKMLSKGLRANNGEVPQSLKQVRRSTGTIRPVKRPVRNTAGQSANAGTTTGAKQVNVPVVGNAIPGMPRPGTGEMLMRTAGNSSASNFIPESVGKTIALNNALQKLNVHIPGMPRPGTGELIMRNAPAREAAVRRAFLNPTQPKPGHGVLLPGAQNATKATDEAAKAVGGAAKATDEAAKTVGSSVGSWMGRHPYLTIGAGVGLGAGGAAVGYNSGESTGREEAAKALQLYYSMRESMQRQNLQSANSSFLSRLANLFGTGELSNMIG